MIFKAPDSRGFFRLTGSGQKKNCKKADTYAGLTKILVIFSSF